MNSTRIALAYDASADELESQTMEDVSQVADLIVSYLEQMGIEYVFGVPGGAIEAHLEALERDAIHVERDLAAARERVPVGQPVTAVAVGAREAQLHRGHAQLEGTNARHGLGCRHGRLGGGRRGCTAPARGQEEHQGQGRKAVLHRGHRCTALPSWPASARALRRFPP